MFTEPSDAGDGEQVRWYLEDYAEFPADPAPAIAQEAEDRLAELGTTLFRRVFEANRDTMRVWDAVVASLPQARVEVDADPGAGPGLAWELLRDPDRDAAVPGSWVTRGVGTADSIIGHGEASDAGAAGYHAGWRGRDHVAARGAR